MNTLGDMFDDDSDFRSALEPEGVTREEQEWPELMPPLKTIGQAVGEGSFFAARVELGIRMTKFTESPIETMFGLAMVELFEEKGWELIPQLRWRNYRIDWCLRRPDKPDIFIECDGREFHTRPEHVARDRRRDAEIRRAGIRIFRFTGSQIYDDARACALQVYAAAKI